MVKLPLNILQLIMWILPLTLLQIHGNMFLVAKVQELEVSKAGISCIQRMHFKPFCSEITFFWTTLMCYRLSHLYALCVNQPHNHSDQPLKVLLNTILYFH